MCELMRDQGQAHASQTQRQGKVQGHPREPNESPSHGRMGMHGDAWAVRMGSVEPTIIEERAWVTIGCA